MRVLLGCEFSGIVREAFASRGHRAMSCDLLDTEQPCSENARHFKGDISGPLMRPEWGWWDMFIAFPPCTHLASSGARWWPKKQAEQLSAIEFVTTLAGQPIKRIAIENPVGRLSSQWRKPDQIIHPWQFGHGETKTTCLWLKGLPMLKATNIVEGREPRIHWHSPSPDRWRNRSRTYQGIADAMAEQWGGSSGNASTLALSQNKSTERQQNA